MKGKAALLVGAAAGYVLGARAGRERYDQLMSQANRLWNDPKVQEKAGQAQDLAKQAAHKTADTASGKAQEMKGKVGSGSSDSGSSAPASSGSSGSPSAGTTTPPVQPARPSPVSGTASGSGSPEATGGAR